MTTDYPIADTMLAALEIAPERVASISYWANADGTEGGNVTLTDDAIEQAKSALNRHPQRDMNYRASLITNRCSTCQSWQGTGDGKGVCSALSTTAPFAGQVITPSDMYCTLYEAIDPTNHGDYVPPVDNRTDAAPDHERAT